MKLQFLIILLMPLFTGCNDESSSVTSILLETSSNGLEVTLSGSITNQNQPITQLKIDWGDQRVKVLTSDFDTIDEVHKYENEGSYSINTSAINNLGDTTNQVFSITASFNETSLAGINEKMYKQANNEYLFLTINLHTYQEDDQAEKFNMLIDVIGGMDIDFITFQECAQHKSSTLVDATIREDNMALIISTGLANKYNWDYEYAWDWAHYGWNVWEEGVAVMSKYPITDKESKYISSSVSKSNIESRKVIYGSCQLPDGKLINLFSAHTHWRTSETSEEQNNQIRGIQSMVETKSSPGSYSFVAGDFNGNPTSDAPWSEGYFTMIGNGNYVDSYLIANPDANNKPAQSKYHTVLGSFPGRIDYIFIQNNPDIEVVDSQIIFTEDVVGKISDHFGVITKIKLK